MKTQRLTLIIFCLICIPIISQDDADIQAETTTNDQQIYDESTNNIVEAPGEAIASPSDEADTDETEQTANNEQTQTDSAIAEDTESDLTEQEDEPDAEEITSQEEAKTTDEQTDVAPDSSNEEAETTEEVTAAEDTESDLQDEMSAEETAQEKTKTATEKTIATDDAILSENETDESAQAWQQNKSDAAESTNTEASLQRTPEQTESLVGAVEQGLETSQDKTDVTDSDEIGYAFEPEEEAYMTFNFDNEDLTTIINQYAQKKGINIVLPWGEDAIKFKITFSINEDVPLGKAENYLRLFIHMAGYMMYKHNSYYVVAKKKDQNAGRKPVALYIDVPPEELPRSQEEIRAIYYLRNLKVPKSKGTEPINLILQNLLSGKNAYLFDQKTNGVIISDRSANIAAAMDIILELDAKGSPEIVSTLQLKNSDATSMAKKLKDELIGSTEGSPQVSSSQGAYFEPTTRVFANARTNTLIIIGKAPSVRRIKDFTQEYLDADPDAGRSVLHVYDLQYLDARDFAPTLQSIVQGVGGEEQATKKTGGSQQYFSGVKVVAEAEQAAEVQQAGDSGETAQSQVTVGGNRLLIAARSEDWKRVKRLIQKLDRPEKQVIIETMIVDITASKNKEIKSQTRTPESIPTPSGTEFQTVHIDGNDGRPILDPNNTTLISDLLRLLGPNSDQPSLATLATQPVNNDNGALILSLGDPCDNGKIWSVLKILDKYVDREVISHPFFVTKNNVKASESRTVKRRAPGKLIQNNDTAPIEFEDFEAKLAVEVTPRISSLQRVNLEINVEVEDFESQDPSNFNRITREVLTNANLESGQILVLGGLTRINNRQSETKVPILGDLPIVGSLFRGSEQVEEKTNLAIFLTPTIVDPKLRSGLNRYTSEKIESGYERTTQGDLFDSLRDPITHFFFNRGRESDKEIIEDYLDETSYETTIYNSYKDPQDYEADMEVAHIDDETIARLYNKEDELRDLLEHEDNPLLSSHTG
jgi:general secretion pathway protein D